MTRKSTTLCSAAAIALSLGVAAATQHAQAGTTRIFIGSMPIYANITSLQEKRFESVVRQNYDFSCGSAALATLLTYHYDRPIDESAAFDAMWDVGDKNKIRKEGFSLLDMKKYLTSVGLRSDGFRVPLDKLREIGVPTITLITTRGYTHFVVLRGVNDTHVILGDPSLGSRTVTREAFLKEWSGIAFAIHNDARLARSKFNLKRDLPFEDRAHAGLAINRQTLANITIMTPGINEF